MPTITLDFSVAHAQRLAAVVGKTKNLRDGGGQPRSATNQEVKDWYIEITKSAVKHQEKADAEIAALAAVSVPDIDIT